MIVCIAEKPSVARDICNVLAKIQGINIDTRSTSRGYWDCGQYQVTWTFGHLCELKEPHEYNDRWRRWDAWNLPMIPDRFGIRLKEDEGIKKQFGVIEQLMKSAETIINCGDAGQEGELIQRWVMQLAGVKCPVKRLWISSLTEEAIKDGFNSLKDQTEYLSLYEAGLCRAIGDWLLGLNATRLYTMKYQQERGQVLSIGRVQTPTLALIVNRHHEIENFVPQQSWILSTIYRGTKFLATKGEFKTEDEGRAVLDSIRQNPFFITDLQTKKGTESAPRLYDLTSLQVDCNRKFGFSADMTLQVIQSLYEKKYTTYPRVDTTFLPDDVYPKCAGILKGIRGYEQFTTPLEGKKLPKTKKVFDSSKVTDHHAIIPTGVPAANLTDMERQVYDLVARSFIASFYPDCRFLSTTVIGEVSTSELGKISFKATGKQITDEGWKVVFKKEQAQVASSSQTQGSSNGTTSEDGEERNSMENSLLPEFTVGENGPHEPGLAEKWTQPPKPYTEATLLRAMETAGKMASTDELRDVLKENGIGRPSTRASIIETLFKRRYIRKERKNLIPTSTGIDLIGIIHEELLKSAELTGIWEKKLRDIEYHKYKSSDFISELKQMVTDIIHTVRNDHSNRRVTATTDEDLKKKTKSKATKTSAAEKKSSTSQQQTQSTGVSENVPAGFQPRTPARKKKETPTVTNNSAKSFDTDLWIGMKCPVCGVGSIIKGRTAYGCSRWNDPQQPCGFRRPF